MAGPTSDFELKKMKTINIDGYEGWSPAEVSNFFADQGLTGYEELFIENELSGDRVVLMAQEDLADLKIPKVGHRVAFMKILRDLKSQARLDLRKKEIAHEEEAYDGCYMGELCFTACGLCPRDPDQYILKAGKLQIKEYDLYRICGSFKCICLGGEYHNDNITLDRIKDVDTEETTSGFLCCKIHKVKLDLAVSAGVEAEAEDARVVQKQLFMEGDKGIHFADLILQQVEMYMTQQRGV